MPSGGPRRPSQPAPVSGPGRLSRRTDGGPTQPIRDIPDAAYGEQQAYTDTQRTAGLALAGGALSLSGGGGGGSPSPVPVTPFNAPSQYPGQPVTNGSSLGAGVGFEALGIPNEEQLREQDRQNLVQYLPVLEYLANMPSAMPSLRAQVRKIKAANNI